jgi:hypothetical protein
VLPYHRVQLAGDVPATGREVSGLEELEAGLDDEACTLGVIARGAGTATYRLLRLEGEPPVVRALHEDFLDAQAPGDALRFTHSVADAEAAVLRGHAIAAYVLPPTTPERVRQAIHHGARLPRKSTFFWPKPRTGMVFMPLN